MVKSKFDKLRRLFVKVVPVLRFCRHKDVSKKNIKTCPLFTKKSLRHSYHNACITILLYTINWATKPAITDV